MSAKSVSRREFLRMACVCAAGVGLAACAPAPAPVVEKEIVEVTKIVQEVVTEQVEVTAVPAGLEPVTVQLLTKHGVELSEYIAKSLDNFKEQYPYIEVEWEDVTQGYDERLSVMLASHSLPDVFNNLGFNMLDWWLKGGILDIIPYLDTDPDISADDFIKAIQDTCLIEGDYWGLAYDASVMVVFYNKDLFDQMGVPYPQDSWTKEDFLEAALALTTDETWGLTGLPSITGWPAESWYLSHGVRVVSEDRTEWVMVGAEAEEITQWLIDLELKHKVTAARGSEVAGFGAGLTGMQVVGQWYIPGYRQLDFNWDIAAFPTGDAGHNPITQGGTYTIKSYTSVPDAAWQMLKWVCGDEDWQVNVYGKPGYSIPSLNKVAESAWMAPIEQEGQPPANGRVVITELEMAVPGYSHPAMAEGGRIWAAEIESVILGEETVPEALDSMKVQIDESIQKALATYRLPTSEP